MNSREPAAPDMPSGVMSAAVLCQVRDVLLDTHAMALKVAASVALPPGITVPELLDGLDVLIRDLSTVREAVADDRRRWEAS